MLNKFEQRVKKVNSLLCVGLDSDFDKIPAKFKKSQTPQFDFNKFIIDQTHDLVAAYKPNFAFYEARGVAGLSELKMTMDYLQEKYPDIFTIADAKRGDIESTNKGYITEVFDQLNFDAITLHPFLGQEAMQVFLDKKDKTSIFLCKTSNPGSGEFQNLKVGQKELWQVVAENISQKWNKNNNCMLVVGATYPKELAEIRKIIGEMTLLIPGIGAQGGNLAATMKAGLNKEKMGLIINSSRGIIFSDSPRESAQKLRNKINHYR